MAKKFIYSIIIIGILSMSYTKIKNNRRQEASQDSHNHSLINYDTSEVFAAVMQANKDYQSSYIAAPSQSPIKRVAIITCMDSRINLPALMGPQATTMFTIRNAGGRVSPDALRSLTLAHKLLGVEQVFLIHHTDCGLQKITNQKMNNLLEKSILKAELKQNCNITLEPLQDNNECDWQNEFMCGGVSDINKHTDWLTIEKGLYESVVTDVKKIRDCDFIPSNIPVYGFIFNMATGELIIVPEALEVGKASPVLCK